MTEQPNLWERLSSEEQDRFGTAMIDGAVARFAAAGDRLDNWQLHGTSRLAEDNHASRHYRRMTEELHHLLSSARDHLDGVAAAVRAREVPPFRLFTLIRSSVETSATVVWLQNGGTLDKRIFRLIQMQWSQREAVNTYTNASGIDSGPNDARLEALLDATARGRRGIQRDYHDPTPSITDMLIETDRAYRRPGLSGLQAWRACSGMTHGNVHFSVGVMRETPIPDAPADGPTQRRTAAMSGLAMMLDPAVAYFERALQLAEEHSQPRNGRPAFF